MPYTPFGKGGNPFEDLGRSILQRQGIVPTENPWQCHIFIANHNSLSQRFILAKTKLRALVKPMLVWTHEPRYCKIFTKTAKGPGMIGRVHFMNGYTGDLYLNNYSFYSWAIEPPKLDIAAIEASDSLRSRPIGALLTYINDPETRRIFIKGDRNLDLCALRQEIALAGHARNLVDIYGRDWPGNISTGLSKAGDGWHGPKIDILRSYRFNLCLENTSYDYYCTEKIWDAIHAGCLPIYYGKNNRIYDDFPRDSFLDAAQYSSVADLLDHVETMSKEEYRERRAKCISVYNRFLEKDSFEAQYERAILSTANRVKSIVLKTHDGNKN